MVPAVRGDEPFAHVQWRIDLARDAQVDELMHRRHLTNQLAEFAENGQKRHWHSVDRPEVVPPAYLRPMPDRSVGYCLVYIHDRPSRRLPWIATGDYQLPHATIRFEVLGDRTAEEAMAEPINHWKRHFRVNVDTKASGLTTVDVKPRANATPEVLPEINARVRDRMPETADLIDPSIGGTVDFRVVDGVLFRTAHAKLDAKVLRKVARRARERKNDELATLVFPGGLPMAIRRDTFNAIVKSASPALQRSDDESAKDHWLRTALPTWRLSAAKALLTGLESLEVRVVARTEKAVELVIDAHGLTGSIAGDLLNGLRSGRSKLKTIRDIPSAMTVASRTLPLLNEDQLQRLATITTPKISNALAATLRQPEQDGVIKFDSEANVLYGAVKVADPQSILQQLLPDRVGNVAVYRPDTAAETNQAEVVMMRAVGEYVAFAMGGEKTADQLTAVCDKIRGASWDRLPALVFEIDVARLANKGTGFGSQGQDALSALERLAFNVAHSHLLVENPSYSLKKVRTGIEGALQEGEKLTPRGRTLLEMDMKVEEFMEGLVYDPATTSFRHWLRPGKRSLISFSADVQKDRVLLRGKMGNDVMLVFQSHLRSVKSAMVYFRRNVLSTPKFP